MTQDPKMLADLRENLAGNITLFSHHKAMLLKLVDEKISAIRTASERPAAGEREPLICLRCGAQVYDPCETDMQEDRCELPPDTPTAPAGDGITPIGFDETEEQYIARLEAEVARLRSSDRTAVIKECAEVAEGFRRQMPPGADRVLVRKIEDAIMGLAHSSTDRGGK